MRRLTTVLVAWCVFPVLLPAASYELQTARLELNERGVARVVYPDGSSIEGAEPAFALETDRTLLPRSVRAGADRVAVEFEDGSTAAFSVNIAPGVAVLRLREFSPKSPIPKNPPSVRRAENRGATSDSGTGSKTAVRRLGLFRVSVPAGARTSATLNAAFAHGRAVALMGAEPNVRAWIDQAAVLRGDRAGCSHEFTAVSEARQGRTAARFTATCNATPSGWSVHGKTFPAPRDLTGCKAIRAWVQGDGKGQQLKIQLFDGAGGYRDNYLPIDFTGWRQVTLAQSALDTVRYDRVTALNVYYNGLPANQTVSCLVDGIEAVLVRGGREEVVMLEDFEPDSPMFNPPAGKLSLETVSEHGLEPAAFGVIACAEGDFFAAVERFETLAGMPSPRPGGAWNKQSPWVRRSYFFLTDFRESQFDEALALARRGGFSTILLGQESWCKTTGHFEVPTDRFPDGLSGLARTVERFRGAGFNVGLHFLAASIYEPDSYLTPVPDRRLVTGAETTLAAGVDAKQTTLSTETLPEGFPAEDGGYMGQGTVLRIGDELIGYGTRSVQSPWGFSQCRRGHLGTRATAHRKGERVAHLVRSYGYHLYDLDSTLADEVAKNFARVANACKVDMLYFDGSERLQGDHWYYNARLHKLFYDKLENRNVLLQASSYSHYSWHLLARSASADGHGDLKGYLDERSGWFETFSRDGMPLDIGWYYGYDPMATPDMYEYVLGATIGYGASLSFQVSVAAAAQHPFTAEILDRIARYERLRLSGRVGEAMRNRLHIDPVLGGEKTPDQRAALADRRRDYRLVGQPGAEAFQRVVYTPWRELPGEGAAEPWQAVVPEGGARVGWQVHALGGAWLAPGPSYRASDAVVLETFDELAPYGSDAKARGVAAVESGPMAAVSEGVHQRLESSTADAREGGRCAVYRAESRAAGSGRLVGDRQAVRSAAGSLEAPGNRLLDAGRRPRRSLETATPRRQGRDRLLRGQRLHRLALPAACAACEGPHRLRPGPRIAVLL